MRGVRALLAVGVVAATLVGGRGDAVGAEPELIASAELRSGEWVAFKVELSEETFLATRVGGGGSYRSLVVGRWVMRADGSETSLSLRRAWSSAGTEREVYIESRATGPVVDERSGSGGSSDGDHTSGVRRKAGTYIAVFVVGGDAHWAGEVGVAADSGAELLSTTSGAVFSHGQRDFESDASVIAGVGPAGVRAIRGGRLSEQADGRMFAVFSAKLNVGIVDLRVHAPEGSDVYSFSSPVISLTSSVTIVSNSPPGTYGFGVDALGASALFSDLTLVGADVTLP